MRAIIVLILTLAMVGVPGQLIAQEEQSQAPVSQTELEVLQAREEQASARTRILEAEIKVLRAELEAERLRREAGALSDLTRGSISVGVMPIDRAYLIPYVGESFREVLVSALNEAGIQATESLDDETLDWVRKQIRLSEVEKLVNSDTTPTKGKLLGVTHFLLSTVTSYQEEESTRENATFLLWKVYIGSGVRVRTGRLVADFRLVDAESGKVVDAFRTEAPVMRKESGTAVWVSVAGGVWYRSKQPVPELAARFCAVQVAQQLVMTAEQRLGIKRQLPPRLTEEPEAEPVPEAKSKPEPTQSASAKSGPFP